jgi:RNA polymerase sigma-70 factor (ECF subfamily)
MQSSSRRDQADTWIAEHDLELAKRALLDRKAAEEVLSRVTPRIQYAIRVLMGNDRDRDDVLSQTMLEVLESIGNFKGKGSLEAWAGKIAFHTVTGHTKRRGMIERVMMPETHERGIAKTTPEQEASRGRIRERVTKALDKLPMERRNTLVLRLVFGHSIQEIAGLTDVPVNTVRSRLRTGLRELRRGVASERDYLLAK